MNDLENIREWIRESPERNRKKLCEKLKNNNEFAYKFTFEHLEYQDFVKHFIHNEEWAYTWARDIGNKDFMKHKISYPRIMIWWAYDIGNREFMKQTIKENGNEYWIERWNSVFKKNQI